MIIALSALSVSASAAFYSVSGLSKLFAGASLEVIIMATSLEVAKLVIASLLYQYWDKLNRLLRIYLTTAATILVVITSAGIYGFLSGAYQETATKSEIMDKEIAVLDLKRERFVETRDNLLKEKTELSESISELRKGLSNNVIQYRDSETGQIITTTSSSTRRVLNDQLSDALKRKDQVSKNLEAVTDSLSGLDIMILEIESGTELSSELGPLKYISELTGIAMNKVVNYLLLIIIFVFDPLAISLVIGANFAFSNITGRKKKELDPDDLSDEELYQLSKQYSIQEQESEKEKYTPTDDELERLQKILERYEPKDPAEDDADKKYLEEVISDDPWMFEDLKQSERFLNDQDFELDRLKRQNEEIRKENKETIEMNVELFKKLEKLSKLIVLDDDEIKKDLEEREEEIPMENNTSVEDKESEPSTNKRLTYAPRGKRNTRIDRF